MGTIGIATNPNVAPTGYALAHNDVWVNGVKHEVIIDQVDLDNRLEAAGTAGIIAVETEVVIAESEESNAA